MSLAGLIVSHVKGLVLNAEHFAETVMFNCHSGAVELTAVVDIDEPIGDDSGETPTTYTGRISIAESDFPKLTRDRHMPLTVCARNEEWHLVDSGHEYHGMREFSIRRQERRLSNAVALDGKQKRYGKLSPNP